MVQLPFHGTRGGSHGDIVLEYDIEYQGYAAGDQYGRGEHRGGQAELSLHQGDAQGKSAQMLTLEYEHGER